MNLLLYKFLHPKFDGRHFVLQEANSLLKRCFFLFLALFFPMFLIFSVPIYATLSQFGTTETFFISIKDTAFYLFCFSFIISACIFLIGIYFKCNDTIIFDKKSGSLYVNGVESKILKTEFITLFVGRFDFDNTFYSGIYKFRLQNGRTVNMLTLLPPIEKMPANFNIRKAEIRNYISKTSLLYIVLGLIFLFIGIFLFSKMAQFSVITNTL